MPVFAEWRPDAFNTNSAYAAEALGVLPRATGYGPFPSLAAISESLDATCRGAFTASAVNGAITIFAFTAEKAFKFAGVGSAWSEVTGPSGPYNLADGEFWSFAQFGTLLVATNINDDPQYIDVDAGSAFADLGGSPPRARFCQVVGDQLFLLNRLPGISGRRRHHGMHAAARRLHLPARRDPHL
ncbi:MAG: hypothetical protein J0H94_04390 [Rhizobiales bacterium]|nr:hypothetical protein [Hyphomicrobiales bacterium]